MNDPGHSYGASLNKKEDDTDLSVRAAWLHYVGKLTQTEVAEQLGVSGQKAHRLITRANQEGIVKVSIDGHIAACTRLERNLACVFGLDYCEVVPDVLGEDSPIQTLGVAGAKFLAREMIHAKKRGGQQLIGLGHGRTLTACIRELPVIKDCGVEFVSLLGGLTQNFSANPYDVIHQVAQKTGAVSYVMPVPLFANSQKDREVLLAQHGISRVMLMARQSPLKIVGIGTVEDNAQLVASGMIQPEEIEEVKANAGVGELLGHFFNDDGVNLETALTARTLSVGLSDLKSSRIVALAGGREKVRAIGSILMGGFLSGLITDERTATALLTSKQSLNEVHDNV